MITTEVLIADGEYYDRGNGCVDADGYPHFVVCETRDLVYVSWDGASWQHEVALHKTTGSLFGSAIGIHAGLVHIVTIYRTGIYPNYTYYLLYVTNSSGSWVEETLVSGTAIMVEFPYLALDSTGLLHIVWATRTGVPYTRTIKYTYGSTGAWTTETILADSVSFTAQLPMFRLRMDATDTPYVLTTDANDLVLYARVGGVWAGTVLVENCAGDTAGVELLIDAAGKLHVLYVDYSEDRLHHLHDESGAWAAVTTTTAYNNFQSYIRAACSGAGQLHVIGADYGPNPVTSMSFVRYSERDGGEWSGGDAIDTGAYEVYDFAFTASARGWFMLYSPDNGYYGLFAYYEVFESPEPPTPSVSGQGFDLLVGTLDIYVAPVGTALPAVTETPVAPWVYLGATDGEQIITHGGALQYWWDNEHRGPRKAVRPEEQLTVNFSLVGLTLETYARVLHEVANVAPGAEIAPTKRLPLERGFAPAGCALLLRGEALSPYGMLPGYYWFEHGVLAGEPQLVWARDKRVALECEYGTVDDGLLVVHAGDSDYSSCLFDPDGTPALEVIATYDTLAEDTLPEGTQRLLYGIAADDTHIFQTYYDVSTGTAKVFKIPYRNNEGVFTGSLTGASWGSIESSYVGMSNEPFACAVDDNYVYVGTERGLFILDKSTLTQLGACEYIAEPWNGAPFLQQIILSADGQYVYGGGSGFGMAVFDISDPENPTYLYYDALHDCEYLVYDGERYLYVVDDSWSFAVFDMSLPASPVLAYFSDQIFGGTNYQCGGHLSEDVLALGEVDGEARVQLFNVSDRTDPVLLYSYLLPGSVLDTIYDVWVVGDYLLVLTADAGSQRLLLIKRGTYSIIEELQLNDFPDRSSYGFCHVLVVDDRYVIVNLLQLYVAVIDCCAPIFE